MCEIERKYLEVVDGLCLPTVVLPGFSTMQGLADMSDWFSTAAHYAMRNVRLVTDEAVYAKACPFYGEEAALVDAPPVAAPSCVVAERNKEIFESCEIAGWTCLVLPRFHSAVVDLLGDEVDMRGLSGVPLSWFDYGRIFSTSVVVADNAVLLTDYGGVAADRLSFSALLAVTRGLSVVGGDGPLSSSSFSRARIRATEAYVVACDDADRCLRGDEPGTCARVLLRSDYRYACRPWVTLRSLLLMPVVALSSTVSEFFVVAASEGLWHVTRTPVEGMNVLCVLAAVSSLADDWPDGSIGASLAEVPVATVCRHVALDDVLGGSMEDNLRDWLVLMLGRDFSCTLADLFVVTRAKALLNATQKNRLAMLAAAGDSVITLVLATANASIGCDAQEHQRLRSLYTTNANLSRIHSIAFPTGSLATASGVDLASSKASADALEACVGMVFLSAGYDKASVLVHELRVLCVD